jgi:hypothetical protein
MLHLLEDVPRSDDKDAFGATTTGKFGDRHADLERLAQADRVGDQDARPQVFLVERLRDGSSLVLELVDEHPVRDGECWIAERHWRAAKRGLQPEPGAAVSRRVVRDQGGLAWVEDVDPVLEIFDEGRCP